MKLLKTLFLFGLFFFFGNTVNAYYNIQSYTVNGDIKNDGTIDVKENIDAYFYTEMHGIERVLNSLYTVENLIFKVFYDNIKLNNDNFTTYNEYGNTVIRIGDADKTIQGEHNYDIDYSMYGVIRNFSGMGYSELYWNVIGYDWDVNISNVKVKLNLPKVYTGFTKDDFIISLGYSEYKDIDNFPGDIYWDENNIYINYTGTLSSYQGITLAAKFANNYFEYDHDRQAELFYGYKNDYSIEKNSVQGVVHKDGTIDFKNTIDLKVHNPIDSYNAYIQYKYFDRGTPMLTILKNLSINGNTGEYEEYDTTELNQHFKVDVISGKNQTIANYSMYGLVRPFTGDDENWAYKIFLPLPVFITYESPKNIELELKFPESEFPDVCTGIFREDIDLNIGGYEVDADGFYENGGTLRCEDNTLYLNTEKAYDTSIVDFGIKLGDLGFELDDEVIGALREVGDGQFYYNDNPYNWQSVLFLIGMLLTCGGFMSFMKNRYAIYGKNEPKYIVQYDAPKGVDPSEAGAIIDDVIDGKDITALIYQWASKGYIKILTEGEKNNEFYIQKLKELPKDTKKYQSELFNELFKKGNEYHFPKSTSDSEKKELYKLITKAKKSLKEYIDGEKWYTTKFDYVKGEKDDFKSSNKWFVGCSSLLWIFVYCIVVTIINSFLKPVRYGNLVFFFLGIVLIIASYKSKDKELNTVEGNEILKHCLGYKEFLMKVDKKKFETLTKEDPLFIEKALPYAVVFGVSTQFIENITPEDISWFDGDLDALINSISYINKSVNYTPYVYTGSSYSGHSSYSYSSSSGHSSGSSFSGGYSSGGGGGGGGGRGW